MARQPRISAALLRLMAQGARHAWTIEGLQQGLAGAGTGGDFSSVFRAAEKLLATGAVHKVVPGDGRARYELTAPHHDHLLCLCCDELLPLPCPVDQRVSAAAAAASGADLAGHELVFRGVCPECRAAAEGSGRC